MGESETFECNTVYIQEYDDGLEPRYKVTKNATTWTRDGPNGEQIGESNHVILNGVPLDVSDKLCIGDMDAGYDFKVKFDEDVVMIETVANFESS